MDPHGIKVWLQKFFALYGIMFVGSYIASFFIFITLQSKFNVDVSFPGDVYFDFFGTTVYLPFTTAFAFALFFTLIFQVYRFLKS